jgi:hypothetical protein
MPVIEGDEQQRQVRSLREAIRKESDAMGRTLEDRRPGWTTDATAERWLLCCATPCVGAEWRCEENARR